MRSLSVACGALSVFMGVAAQGGPLNPPAGAVISSGKTLVEAEPRTAITLANTPGDADSVFKITQPGSYYLTGNVSGVANKHGIEVAADFVTIDLNGFSLLGVNLSRDAVRSDGGPQLTGLAVKNGTITGWTNGSGVYAGAVAQCRVENVTILTVGFEGVWFGAFATVDRVDVRDSRGGIRVGANSTVRDSTTYLTDEKGIYTGNESVVTGCTVRSSTLAGIDVQSMSTVERCKVRAAGSTGVQGTDNCTYRQVSVVGSTGPGISGSVRCVFSDCNVDSAGDSGILGFQDCRVERCSVTDAASQGVSVGSGSVVLDTSAHSSGINGVFAASSCTVRGCTVTFNSANGIVIDQRSVAAGNNCANNGTGTGAGIRVTGSGSRIEDNHCSGADFGIQVAASSCIIVRNTCSGNTTNWSFAANNVFGPIVDRTVPASGVVSGNSAADSSGSTHPNANFTH